MGLTRNTACAVASAPVADQRTGSDAKLRVPGEEICVKVRLDDLFDAQAFRLGVPDALGNVALGINNHCPTGSRVADQVARTRRHPR